MDIKEVGRVVSKMKAALFKQSNSYSIGMLKSHFRGSGLQFKEHRVYSHGDDVRFIDWKMLAKTKTPFVKTFEEERNVEICIVVDISPSMFMGFYGVSKFQAAIEICCLLYLLSEETSDKVHVILSGEQVYKVPATSGEKGISYLIATLEKNNFIANDGRVYFASQGGDADKEKRYKEVMRHLGKRKELVLLSDFDDFLNTDELKKIVARRNVHGFRLLGPLDLKTKLPFQIFSSWNNVVRVASKGEHNHPLFKGRVKDLKVEERYLEKFIREMI